MSALALVTGGTGIVGANTVRALLDAEHKVRVMVRPESDRRGLQDLPVEMVEGDVLDAPSVAEAMRGCYWVFHCAASFTYGKLNESAQTELAVQGTINVIRAAKSAGVRRVVVTSSSVTMGSSSTRRVQNEDSVFLEAQPSAYTLSKVRQELAAFEVGSKLGVEVIAVCPTLVMGEYDYRLGPSNGNLVNYLNDPMRCTFLGGCNVVTGHDVGRAHVTAARHGVAGSRYLAGGDNIDWKTLHRTVSELTGSFGPSVVLNHTAAYIAAAAIEAAARLGGRKPSATRDEAQMACRFYWYDSSRLAALNWRATSSRQVLAEGVAWVLARGFVSDSVVASLRPSVELRRFKP